MINISINIETDGPLTALESAVLEALSGVKPGTVEPLLVAEVEPIAEAEVEPVAEAQVEPVEAAEPPKRTRRTKAEMAAARAAEEAPTPTEMEAERLGIETPEGGATLDDAVAIATQLVSEGRTTDIKDYLAEVGFKRVSELKGSAIDAFVQKFSA